MLSDIVITFALAVPGFFVGSALGALIAWLHDTFAPSELGAPPALLRLAASRLRELRSRVRELTAQCLTAYREQGQPQSSRVRALPALSLPVRPDTAPTAGAPGLVASGSRRTRPGPGR